MTRPEHDLPVGTVVRATVPVPGIPDGDTGTVTDHATDGSGMVHVAWPQSTITGLPQTVVLPRSRVEPVLDTG
jgi:hypothetical protein